MKHCHLVLFMILVFTLVHRCQGMGRCQLPVKEGSAYTMNCSYPLSTARQFHWNISSNGTSRKVYTCNLSKKRCFRGKKYQINVTKDFTGTEFKSSLTISNTTAEHRNNKLHCIVWDPSIHRLTIIKTCKVKPYHAPEFIECESVQLDKGRIKQTCHTPKVYPGIFCKLFQAIDGEFEKVPSKMTYKETPTSDSQDAFYYSASCSFNYPSNTTDKDYFKLKMFASVNGRAVPGSEKTISINIPTMPFKVPATISNTAKTVTGPINRLTKSRQIPINAAPQQNSAEGTQIGEIITKVNILIFMGSFIGVVIFVPIIVFIYFRRRPQNNGQYNSVIKNNEDPTYIDSPTSVV